MNKRRLLVKPFSEIQLSKAELSGNPVDLTMELVNVAGNRSSKFIGPPRSSSIHTACMRQHVICTIEPMSVSNNYDFARRLTFEIGDAIHYRIQNSPDFLGDIRRGYWKCKACGRITFFGKPPLVRCIRCGADREAFEYWEYSLSMREPYFFSGHPDMFVDKGTIRVLEIKSMDGDKFEKLAAPLADHIWQVQGYMWACSLLSNDIGVEIDPDYAYIMYVSKKEVRKHLPFKTFFVRKDRYVLEQIIAKLETYKVGVAGGPWPHPIDDCIRGNFEGYISNTCPAKGLCQDEYLKSISKES